MCAVLKIRDQQIHAFRNQQSDNFKNQLMFYLQGEFSSQVDRMTESQLKIVIDHIVEKLSKNNIRDKNSILNFLNNFFC